MEELKEKAAPESGENKEEAKTGATPRAPLPTSTSSIFTEEDRFK